MQFAAFLVDPELFGYCAQFAFDSDFEEAQALWFDPDSVGFIAKSDDEDRFAIIATLKKKFWVAFYAPRENSIPIISVRRARINERKHYES
jgi:uncharacterized DUF497 family protein